MKENIPVIRLLPDLGDDRPVARDGVVLSFYMRRSHKEVASAVWRALQAAHRPTGPAPAM